MEWPAETNGRSWCEMAKRRAQSSEGPSEASQFPPVVHSSLYLPEPVYEVLRKIAFEERLKIHDLAIEGLDAVLRRRGYPSVENLKGGKKA